MKKGVLDILKGKFLVSGDAPKNWRFLLFISLLAIFMISSSHQADLKVKRISNLNEEVRALRSEFFANRRNVQQLKMESTLTLRVEGRGLRTSENPPQKIVVKSNK
ncbi:FtsL-like putative cell division protein [Croceivirga thetidis]|uniref:S-adenosyl-methyltransferase n=1 Tax=Croceivirga thetidis TaxID=2721623 RepID=A0ABX1GL83_9FLAO|nr:FtsL-like putative cell division protein [Croceivirga thetidis]NKI30408.1 S-adenosyl-methyltransferase [Croceivirga thetidis]